ncbi:Multidrug export protein MepA [Vibrio stylophorae]|uniref:Multidrug export protein MepA n=1 Tax=Vibrio stylophorae TaxID=659351 RepID=A0ABM8ZQA5_9VIBR|nr:MATE family efflux transporter [Vibrio stylophorae]CAH0532449.1 Multidrug export protein MepA [Vibrio stylophorae]
MQQKAVTKTFWRYVIPSVAAMLVSGLYQVIDGIFVGHYIGYDGLAAINLAWPLIGIIMGLGVLIGLGAGSLISIARGEGELAQAKRILGQSFWLIGGLAILIMGVVWWAAEPLLHAQKATGDAHDFALSYLHTIALGAPLSIAAMALPMLIRNDDSPALATLLMAIGALSNVVLDYLLIVHLQWGLVGAAVATLMAQSMVALLALFYFFSRKSLLRLSVASLALDLSLQRKIISLGSSAMVMYLYFSFLLAVHNSLFMQYGGSVTVGAFALIGYIMGLYYMFAEGVSSGMQPPISFAHGAGQSQMMLQILRMGIGVVVVSGLLLVVVLNLFPQQIIALFSADQVLQQVAVTGVHLHLWGMWLDGVLALTAVYFMSVNEAGKSLFVSLGNLAVQLPCLWLFPKLWGTTGIWLVVPISNVMLCSVVLPMLWRHLAQYRQQAQVTQPSLPLSQAQQMVKMPLPE